MNAFSIAFLSMAALALASCDHDPHGGPSSGAPGTLAEVARIFSELPMEQEHLMEVFDAVGSSSGNGYDEEYMLSDLFSNPGAGVGDGLSGMRGHSGGPAGAGPSSYARPLKDLFTEHLARKYSTRGGGAAEVEAYVNSLAGSDIQIYWPYSEEWDGSSFPIITFDPGNGAESNYGYLVSFGGDGAEVTDSVLVDENLAMTRPVWVINRNDDAAYTPLAECPLAECPLAECPLPECPLAECPEPSSGTLSAGPRAADDGRMLYVKSFRMLRNYDSWFGGASEFFVKCGGVDGFRAKNDEELQLYYPAITDFMIVVRRNQLNKTVPFETILMTDYTPQMEQLAFLITEDDGGESTSWKCEAVVKYNSRSYGFTLDIPYRDRDDIVWRGQLSSSFFEGTSEVSGRFGDVIVTFGLR